MLKKIPITIFYGLSLSFYSWPLWLVAANPASLVQSQHLALQEMRAAVNSLQHSSDNHELEIQQVNERFQTIEDVVSSLRKENSDLNKQQNEQQHITQSTLKNKMCNLESDVHRLSRELQQMTTSVKELIGMLAQQKKSLDNLTQQDGIHNKNIELLHAAMKSLMEAMGGPIADGKQDAYRIKSGDTLEKIAIANKTSVKKLKELNGLTTDRIREGQELKLPEL